MVWFSVRFVSFALLAGAALALISCGGGGSRMTPPAPISTSTPSPSSSCPAPPPAGNGTPYAIGATRTWCLAVSTIGTSGVTYQPVATTLVAQSADLNVWVDNADIGQLTTQEWQQIAGDFVPIYTLDTQYFGSRTFKQLGVQSQFTFAECSTLNGPTVSNYETQPNFSVDNDGYGPQIDMVVTNKLGAGEGGYFDAIDLVANASALCAGAFSNEAEVFFAETPMNTQINEPVSFYLDGDVLRTEAHEFQHMLHAINKTYAGFAANGAEVFDPPWIDEGFSMLAEDLAFPSSPGPSGDPIRYAFQFMNAPSNYSLTAFAGLDCAPTAATTPCPMSIYSYTAGNYGAAYLFWRWLVDTNSQGTAILKKVIASQDTSPNGTGVNETLTAGGYTTFNAMFNDFEMAVAASQRYAPQPGPFKYTQNPQGNNPQAFFDSYGSYTIPSPCVSSSPNIICYSANHTATFNFLGPQPPGAPTSPASLAAAGGTLSEQLFGGTANYVPVNGTSVSATDSFSATDTTGNAGIDGGFVALTATQPVGECPPASNKVGCTVTGNPTPTNVIFVVGTANAVAYSGSGPALPQYAINLAADTTSMPPAPGIGPASIVRLPQSISLPGLRGDGFLRAGRPSVSAYQALHRLFSRGVIHRQSIQPALHR